MSQAEVSIADSAIRCNSCDTNVVGKDEAGEAVDPVSLSIHHISKSSPVTPNIEVYDDTQSLSNGVDVVPLHDLKIPNVSPREEVYYAWSYNNGSLCGITHANIDPLVNKYKKYTIDKETNQIIEDTVTTPKRGKCKGFSKRSRNRLIDLSASIDKLEIKEKDILFLTLTYGYHIDYKDQHIAKKHINHFNMRLKHLIKGGTLKKTDGSICTLDEVFWIWKVEPMRSGRLHFHIPIFNCRYIDGDWIRRTWKEITGKEGRVHIENAKNWGNTQQYFSKTLAYVCKEVNEESTFGRMYGLVNKKALEKYRKLNIRRINKPTYYKLRRTLYKLIKVTNERKGKWTKKYSNYVKRWLYGTSKITHKRYIDESIFNQLLSLYS